MYEIIVFSSGNEILSTMVQTYPPTPEEEVEILSALAAESWLDIARLESDGPSDTLSFRDEVEADLEPFTLDPIIEELI